MCKSRKNKDDRRTDDRITVKGKLITILQLLVLSKTQKAPNVIYKSGKILSFNPIKWF